MRSTAGPSPVTLRTLAEVVGATNLLTDPDLTGSYTEDWTGRFVGASPAVVRPASVEELAAVVTTCAKAGVALVPQGGNTGLVGGSVPLHGEIVLSTRRLTAAVEVDAGGGQLTVGAGVSIADLQGAAEAAGWEYGVDFAARDSATVGGSIATNAGGLRVLRHGSTRAQLLGVEAVLGDGSVIRHLHGLLKDNTGYDLGGLLCGSEGTLGIVTAARLRLVRPQPERVVALLAFDSVDDCLAAVAALRRDLWSLDAVELFLAAGLDLVCEKLGLAQPFPEFHEVFLVVEAAAQIDPTGELADLVTSLGAVADVAVAGPGDRSRRSALWRYREAHTEALNLIGPPHKLDVTLPHDALAEFVTTVPAVVASTAPAAITWLFGHAADGNVHVNVTGVEPGDEAVDEAVLRTVAGLGGSISAEHGIGTAKRRWLHLNRSTAEIAAMRAIKGALDPIGILNPNVLLVPLG